MKKINYGKIIYYAWPFVFLGFFIVAGWLYIKPLLPEDIFSFENIKEKIAGVFKGEEAPIDPDEKYTFLYTHTDLKPKTVAELGLEEVFNQEAIKENTVVIKAKNTQELIEAVQKARGGELIELAEGEYEVNLEISKSLTIAGQGSSTVLTALDREKPIITTTGDFQINNLQIKNGRIGLEVRTAKVEVKNVKFTGLEATACYARDSELYFKESYVYDSGSGIKILNSQGEISSSIIKNNQKSGIELRNSEFEIFENIIIDNGSYGVFSDQDSKANVHDNFIDNNTGFEVRIEGEKTIYR